MTRGDARIIDGKLCYAFDVSEDWVSKLSERTRFWKSGDEWKVKSIESENGNSIAWCYLVDPFKSKNHDIQRLEIRLADLENYIDEEVERLQKIERTINKQYTIACLPWTIRIKAWINTKLYRYLNRNLFSIPFAYRFALGDPTIYMDPW